MRTQILMWIKQAKKDLKAAKDSEKSQNYEWACFQVQQAIEKTLKAFFIFRKKALPEPTHSLIFLAKQLAVPSKFYSFLKDLTRDFITTRYPSASSEVPYELYDKEKAKERINKAEEILKWITSQMKE